LSAAKLQQQKERPKEMPIIFSGPMVRAILSGAKTQTRRIVKGLPDGIKCASAIPESGYQWRFTDFNGATVDLHCPYGRPPIPLEPCNRLWVRETWTHYRFRNSGEPRIVYRADDELHGALWRPSIFMRREHSRISLEIVSVKVERLQDISAEDCQSEGLFWDACGIISPGVDKAVDDAWVNNFAHGWNKINAKRGYSWDSNPWVWCIEFRRVEANV
jgi:hypothetical protein